MLEGYWVLQSGQGRRTAKKKTVVTAGPSRSCTNRLPNPSAPARHSYLYLQRRKRAGNAAWCGAQWPNDAAATSSCNHACSAQKPEPSPCAPRSACGSSATRRKLKRSTSLRRASDGRGGYSRMHARTRTRTRTHTHTHAQACTHARTHKQLRSEISLCHLV